VGTSEPSSTRNLIEGDWGGEEFWIVEGLFGGRTKDGER